MKINLKIIILVVIAILANAGIGFPQTFNWIIETVDSDSGNGTSIKVDSHDYPHISYYDNEGFNLKYAKWDGSSWNKEVVASIGAYSYFTSLALDADDYPHISYQYTFDADTRELRYAKWNGASWNTEIVDADGNGGWDSFLVLDSQGYPHISYLVHPVSASQLKYARWNGLAWNIEIVDSSTGVEINHTAMVLEANDYPHISYWDKTNGNLKYARRNGFSWDIEVVDSAGNVGINPSLALDSNHYPHISYGGNFTSGNLKYAKWNGSSWNIEVADGADDVGQYSSLALGYDEYPGIAYRDRANANLKFASWNGTFWELETVDSSPQNVGQCTSMALGNSDYSPHISYLESTTGSLKYAKGVYIIPPTTPTQTPDLGYSFRVIHGLIRSARGENAKMLVKLPCAGYVRLRTYDVTGRRIATLLDGSLPAGSHEILWDGGNAGSGTYLVYFEAEDHQARGKLVLVK